MKPFIYIISVAFIALSCELVIDIEQPDFQSSLVVQSEISNHQSILLFLSKDYYILDRELDQYGEGKGLSGATVQLYEEDQLIDSFDELLLERSYDNEPIYGFYEFDRLPTPGKKYSVTIDKDGYESIRTTAEIPAEPVLFKLGDIEESTTEWGGLEYRLEVTIDDPVGENYYEIDLIQETFQPIFDDFGDFQGFEPISYQSYIRSENLVVSDYQYDRILFTDDLFDGGSYTLNIIFEVGDVEYLKSEFGLSDDSYAVLYVRNCTSDYYNYYNSAALQNWNDGDPFAEPVPIYTNIEGGQGIFGAYHSSADTLLRY